MPRTNVTKTLINGPYATAGVTGSLTAADTVNNNAILLTGNEVVIALNTDTAGAHTVTISSTADGDTARLGDITADSVPACVGTTPGIRVYQRFPLNGWLQADGNLYLTANSALIKFLVVQLS